MYWSSTYLLMINIKIGREKLPQYGPFMEDPHHASLLLYPHSLMSPTNIKLSALKRTRGFLASL